MTEENVAKKTSGQPNWGLIVIIVIALLVLVVLFGQFKKNNSGQPQLTQEEIAAGNFIQEDPATVTMVNGTTTLHLYGRNSCPHCLNVQDWLNARPELLAQVNKKWLDEAGKSAQYAQELEGAHTYCQLTGEIGVPMLYIEDENLTPEERCIVGGQPVIDYLSTFQVEEPMIFIEEDLIEVGINE